MDIGRFLMQKCASSAATSAASSILRPTLIFGHAGTGGALAKLLRTQGHPVHVVGRNGEALKSLSNATGCTYTVCDVCEEGRVEAAVDDALKEFGGNLEGMVYAVGSIPIQRVKDAKASDMLKTFHVNTVGAFEAAKFCYPALSQATNGGSIVMFSTVAARHGFPRHSLISAAKGGIEGLTVAMAAEFSPTVRVNCIALSLTATPLSGNLTGDSKLASILAKLHPMGRLGTPEDGANLAAFLLGDTSTWMTGQVLGLDGGRSTLILG